jgi:hypothetical protein
MSITPDDWFDRFFGNFPFGKRGPRSYFDDMFGGFDQMRKEMSVLRFFKCYFNFFHGEFYRPTPLS